MGPPVTPNDRDDNPQDRGSDETTANGADPYQTSGANPFSSVRPTGTGGFPRLQPRQFPPDDTSNGSSGGTVEGASNGSPDVPEMEPLPDPNALPDPGYPVMAGYSPAFPASGFPTGAFPSAFPSGPSGFGEQPAAYPVENSGSSEDTTTFRLPANAPWTSEAGQSQPPESAAVKSPFAEPGSAPEPAASAHHFPHFPRDPYTERRSPESAPPLDSGSSHSAGEPHSEEARGPGRDQESAPPLSGPAGPVGEAGEAGPEEPEVPEEPSVPPVQEQQPGTSEQSAASEQPGDRPTSLDIPVRPAPETPTFSPVPAPAFSPNPPSSPAPSSPGPGSPTPEGYVSPTTYTPPNPYAGPDQYGPPSAYPPPPPPGSYTQPQPGPEAGQPFPEAPGTRETADSLTTEMLLAGRRPLPAAGWRRTLFRATGGLIRVGESSADLQRRDLINRARTPVAGGHHRVAVMSLKGGVGKTTTAVGLGATLASMRGDRVIAMDANPDRGTLSDKVRLETSATIRDLLNERAQVTRYADVRAFTSQASSRLEILASDRDPAVSVAFSADDYRAVSRVLEHYYSICITDCGTGLLHSAMAGILELADHIVLVSSPSVDGARSASATLDWLEAHGYTDLVHGAVVVLSTIRPRSKSTVDLDRLEQHFASRSRAVVRIPYDAHLEEGAEFELDMLDSETAEAYLQLAALVGDGFAVPRRPPARSGPGMPYA